MIRMNKSVFLALALTIGWQLSVFAQGADVSGAWTSDWGTVYLEKGGRNADGTQSVSGYWDQGAGKRGQITKGHYMPNEGKLIFKYYQPWNQTSGSAKFAMNGTGTSLNGTYTQPNMSGNWNMSRASAPAEKRIQSPYALKRNKQQQSYVPDPVTAPPVVAATTGDIGGTWKSDYGPVILDVDSMKGDGTWRIAGGTYGTGASRGRIDKGIYNPHERTIWFKYTNVKGMVGETNLKLHPQGSSAAGRWAEADGSSGAWNLWR